MRRKSVYVSKWDTKLKKTKQAVKSKETALPDGIRNIDFKKMDKDRAAFYKFHFCESCDLP